MVFVGPKCEQARNSFSILLDKAIPCACRQGLIALPITDLYTHMGSKTSPLGAGLPGIVACHGTAMPVLGRLPAKFFKKSAVDGQDKLNVVGALLLSRELFSSGCYCILTTVERQRVHGNVMRVYRTACEESFVDGEHMLSDTEVLRIYNLKAPYAVVRFSRLRLSVRIAGKASVELLCLLHAARADGKSWLSALQEDLTWLQLCLPESKYSISEWFLFCRCAPKNPRSLIRRACESPPASSIGLGEGNSGIRALASYYTCVCGWSGPSIHVYHAHRGSAHGCIQPAERYFLFVRFALSYNA